MTNCTLNRKVLSEQDARKTVFQMHQLTLQQFIDSYDKPPESIVLDFDGTDDRIHGQQEGRSYNSHYGGYVFLPLYVYCGNHLLVSYLRQVNRTDAHHPAAILSLIVKGIRAHWPEVNIVFRGDAGFYRALLLSWCEHATTSVTSSASAVLRSSCAHRASLLIWLLKPMDSSHIKRLI